MHEFVRIKLDESKCPVKQWNRLRVSLLVRPSTRKNSAPNGLIFMKFDIFLLFFENLSRKFLSLESDKNKAYFTRRPMYVYENISLNFCPKWELFQTKVVEEIRTDILCSRTFFFSKIVSFMITWKKMVQPDSPQTIIRHLRFARWITKATDTHSEYVKLTAFPRQQRSRKSASMLRLYAHCLL